MNSDYLPFPHVIYYPFIAFTLLVISVVVIPRKGLRRLFLESLFWGLVLSFCFDAAMGALNIYHYRHMGAFAVLRAPIWINLAWSPAIMVYLFFKPPMKAAVAFWVYLLSFSLISAMLDDVLHKLGLLQYVHWSPLARLAVAVGWFYAAALVHEKYAPKLLPRSDEGKQE